MHQRRFLIAASLARLIRREHGVTSRIVEGYFPGRPDRDHWVTLTPERSWLVLGPAPDATGREERTEVPCSQAEALLDLCEARVGFECTRVRLRDRKEAVLQRFVAPDSLDLVTVEFEEREDPTPFVPPAWFGPEVTTNRAYDRGSLARVGIPSAEDLPLSSAMLDELLDTLEHEQAGTPVVSEPSPQVREPYRAHDPTEAATEPGPVTEPALRDEDPNALDENALIKGLAEALGREVPGAAPDPEKSPVVRPFRWGKR